MNISPKLPEEWLNILKAAFEAPYFKDLKTYLLQEKKAGKLIYPQSQLIFNAFEKCNLSDLKVVILGQDPYHGPDQAQGLSFSVPIGVSTPPSLKNIFKEIQSDIGYLNIKVSDLTDWANQGVFLLNATLTVEANKAGSHQGKGWEIFTDYVIKNISEHKEHVVFMLWGNFAKRKKALIDTKKHLVLEAAHPSPLSAHQGFIGCKHFSQANAWLKVNGLKEIYW